MLRIAVESELNLVKIQDMTDFNSVVINLELVHQCMSGGEGQEIAGDKHRHLRQLSKGFSSGDY